MAASSSFWVGVQEVLQLLKEHSEKYKRQKQATTKLERWSGWATLAGGVIFVAGELVRQSGDWKVPTVFWVYVFLAVLGLLTFMVGVVMSVVESVHTTRHPFVEHIDRINEALGRECDLVAALEGFDTDILELARARLQLESAKVTARLRVIGGGDGLRTSFVGVAMLVAALISQYEPVPSLTMKSLGYVGIALLLGMSIAGLSARYGVSQADYYSGIIGLALQRKAHLAKKPRESFSRRLGLKEEPIKRRRTHRTDNPALTQ